MHEVYPFPDDSGIFLREWPLDSVSRNGWLGSEPARPVFVMYVPQGSPLLPAGTATSRSPRMSTPSIPW